MIENHWGIIDSARSTALKDAGAPEFTAATIMNPAGEIHLVLIRRSALGDPNVVYNANTPEAPHDQLGPLPPEFVQRVAASGRRGRDGR